MSEADLHTNVVALAKALGWRVWWVWRSVNSPEGWPDLFLLHAGRSEALAIELKRERGRVTGAQADTLALLKRAGIPAYVIRPSDWLDGTIQRLLEGKHG